MYPAAEFRRVGFLAVRRGLLTLLAFVGTVLLFAVTALHLSDPWARHDPPRAILLVWATVAAAGLTLVFELLWRSSRHPFTRCPHCHRSLTDYVPVVTASGCCFHCGEQVLTTPADPPADALIPRADFRTAEGAYQRKAAPVLIGGVLATYFGGFAALVVANHTRLPEPLPAVVFVALAAVAPVSAVAVLRWMGAAGKRNAALACPCCGKLLAGGRMLVAATGNCHSCGGRAILPRVRPLPPPHLGPLWSVAQLTEVGTHRARAVWRALALLGAVSAVTVGLALLGNLFWAEKPLRDRGLSRAVAQWVERAGPPAVGIAGSLVGLVVFRHALRAARRKHPLDCPRCGRDLHPPFARATKCCNQCGWRVVADLASRAA